MNLQDLRRTAKASGAVISYDPNYRASLWSDVDTAVEMMRSAVPFADVLKVSDEESFLLTGCKDPEEAAEKLLAMGPKLVAVTLGSEGVFLSGNGIKEKIPAFSVQSIDTTGAGDSFWGGFIGSFLTLGKMVEEMTREDLQKCAITGNAFAALCVQKRGGIPSIPTKKEVEEFLQTPENRRLY